MALMDWATSVLYPKRENRWIACTDAEKAWKEGWGRFLRFRYISTIGAADAAGAVYSIYKNFEWHFTAAVVVVGLVVVAGLLLARKLVIRNIVTGCATHRLCHSLREDVAKIWQAAQSSDAAEQMLYKERCDNFHNTVTDHIAEVFRQVVADPTINCAIRLAKRTNGEAEYATVGRSQNMCPSRSEQPPVSISSNEGIACFLRQKSKRGVYIIEDIQKAIESAAWKPTPTDSLADVKTLMVAPINGYSLVGQDARSKKTMLGILYITSASHVFGQAHCDLVMAFADLLGLTYPVVTGAWETCNRRQ